ncbi:MAG: hypothetical protein Q4E11_04305 [Corynebacterium sp.]|uniref:hypothetical protein n=1 Tax=Corynebacterium sp. TaxID=1720 RepID=UPI0026DAC897|nr:hypothetical protein [Corynebacterium sp.]MDO5029789.1 hypothetical protein [Corynebacterium sp.]
MSSSWGHKLRLGSLALAAVLVVGLSACSDGDEAAMEDDNGRVGQATGAATSSVAIRDNLAQLAADTAALRQASETLISKETVSDETRKIAQEAEPVCAKQEAQLVKALGVDVDPSESRLDRETITRLENEEGPHADMAYLTLMEGGLEKVLGQWEELENNGGHELREFASSSREELTDIQKALEKRMQY